MLIDDFDFDLPAELIAQKPLPYRDQSRMMVLHRETGDISHAVFADFPKFIEKGEVLVLNDSRVIPARIWGKKSGQYIEFLFLKDLGDQKWEVLCRPAKKVKIRDIIYFNSGFEGKVEEIKKEGKRILRFNSGDVSSLLKKSGFAPLPPYIKRDKNQIGDRATDLERYQTIFAESEGSIAAPTAGLHFTDHIFKNLKEKGVLIVKITLDVGLATFQPVRALKVEDHVMLQEDYSIETSAAKVINHAVEESRPITAVGTTSVRTMESAAKNGRVQPGRNSTQLFIYPGYNYKIVAKLLTNFHLPRSTLFMLTSAFAGREFLLKAYREAVNAKYRFFSYGDCMFIL